MGWNRLKVRRGWKRFWQERQEHRRSLKGARFSSSFIAVAILLLCVGAAAVADGDSKPSEEAQIPIGALEQAQENAQKVPGPVTDPEAAAEMPQEDLDRTEALDLLEAVFGTELQAAAGAFDELHVEKFLADNVAVIPAGEQPDPLSEEEGAQEVEGPTLLHSTVPLRTETDSGQEKTVDLSLEHIDGELQSTNPLVEVGVPQELGDGITLPESDLGINLVGAPEDLSPSNVGGTAAFYPNVAENTDLVVAPTPTGVETLTQIRSADASLIQTYQLSLPDGAVLKETKEGGAEVVDGEEMLVAIAPPDAIDAAGKRVRVDLEVSDDSLVVTAFPEESAQFPILVDPLFQSYKWEANKYQTGIHAGSTGQEEWSPERVGSFTEYPYVIGASPYVPATEQNGGYNAYGLYVTSSWYDAKQGDHGAYIYTVPRYFKDATWGSRPTSFISNMTLTGLTQWAGSPYNDPYLIAGLWDIEKKAWGSSIVYHTGLEGHNLNDANYVYKMPNLNANPNNKIGSVGLWATQNTPNGPGNVRVLSASIELAEPSDPEKNRPNFGSVTDPTKWMDQTPVPIEFSVTDTGLGVYAITASTSQKTWKTSYGCTGVGGSACPKTWGWPYGTEVKPPQLQYEPSWLPTGINTIKLVAEDPLGQVSGGTTTVQVKVDHTAPTLSLSGPITEQGSIGTKWPTYALKVTSADGTTGLPQSGVAEVTIEVDGKVVKKEASGCSTQNCALSPEWILDASQYSLGQHTVKVTATDAVGLSTTKSLVIELQKAEPPTIELSGSMTQQATLGATRPQYVLKVKASALAGSGAASGPPTFASSVGSTGSGNGQFNLPAGSAVDSQSNLWVVDRSNNRVQKFDAAGKYVTQFGTTGSGKGQLSNPMDVAIDASGNLWVADRGNSRLQKFDAEGKYLTHFGSQGTGNGQFSSYGPRGIAIDAQGELWVSDYSGRVQEFNPSGGFIKAVGSYGSGEGQFGESAGLEVAQGKVWVGDWTKHRVSVFSDAGKFLFQFGSYGSGNGQFSNADEVDVDSKGNVWVLDASNGRVQQFTTEGKYVSQFGTKGSGQGQFSFTWPTGIATDAQGNIWVSDVNNNRVQKWAPPGLQSKIASEITIDGTKVGSGTMNCATEVCPVSHEWTLAAPSYAVGKHSVLVKATDGLGRTSTKSLSIQILSDTTKPTLELSGPLATAPEGWVEQESYGLNALATDVNGYGVTSLALSIDGKAVATQSSGCSDGGCQLSLSKPVDMSPYAGGAHEAQLVATDGAGNVTTKTWTLNVDPDGQVSGAEAIDTLEAAEDTSESQTVAPTAEVLEPEQMEAGDNPGLQVNGATLESTGVPNTTTISTQPGGGFTITSPEGKTEFKPAVSEGASTTQVAAGVAGVAANVKPSVDSIIRPVYNGAQTFQAIRSASSPEKYSWTVKLGEGQSLKAVSTEYVEVVRSDGSPVFLITAEAAHDATGKAVPTSLEVSGTNVITLKVEFNSAQFTFPIIAGQGWETKYEVPIYVELPEDEFEIKQREEEEKLYEESEPPEPTEVVKTPFSPKMADLILKPRAIGPTEYAAPPYPPSGGAGASKIRVFTVEPNKECGLSCHHWWANLRNPSFFRGSNWAQWEPNTQVHCSTDNIIWFEPVIFPSMPDPGCGFTGPSKVWKNEGKHLTIWGRYRIGAAVATEIIEFEKVLFLSLQIWVWPNGFQQDRVGAWDCEAANVAPNYCDSGWNL